MNRPDVNRNRPEPPSRTAVGPAEFAAHFGESARIYWLVAMGIVHDAAMAEDVVQEAALVALGKLDQFRPDTNLSAWVAQIVRNIALNRARKEHRRRTTAVDPQVAGGVLDSVAPDSPALARNPGGTGAYAEIDERILRALNEVSEVARACLLLRTLEGLDYAEISRLLEIPEGTAMSHVHRTRRFLRARLAALDPNADGAEGDRA